MKAKEKGSGDTAKKGCTGITEGEGVLIKNKKNIKKVKKNETDSGDKLPVTVVEIR